MKKSWLDPVTQIHRTPVFGKVWLLVAAFAVYAGIWVYIDYLVDLKSLQTHTTFYGLLGLVLGLLLAFRTNTAYDRWWEGRKLWGQLINETRNLAIKIEACVRGEPAEKREVGKWLAGFAEALRDHLRGIDRLQAVPEFQNQTDQPRHVPTWIVHHLYQRIEAWRQADRVEGFELLFLDRHAAALMDICGACERIRNTPLASSYIWYIRQAIGLYLLSLPPGIVGDFGAWTILATAPTAYFMVGVETIAEEIEDPFGGSRDDLPLDQLCQTIRQSVEQVFGE